MVIATTAGYGVTMDTLASTAANFVGGVRPEIAAFVGGGKKRRVSKRSARKGRRVAKRSSRVRKASKRVKKASKRVSKRVSKRKTTRADNKSRIPEIRRRPDVQRLPQGDRKKRLKKRLSDRKIRRSIIRDIESGKHEQARKKMKTLSSASRQSSMDSFLSGIDSGSMPSSKTLRLSDMSDESKKITESQFESARKKLKKAIKQ